MAGKAAGTSSWLTNIGNEFGQVLNSVLTTSEGSGLEALTKGIIDRYTTANIKPPDVLYVDRDCCAKRSSSSTKLLFGDWPNLEVRLDIWHLMRRFADGCTTNAHPLYGTFMSHLSSCIFEFDAEDVRLLRQAKASEIEATEGRSNLSTADLDSRITKAELSKHCRRKTRGVNKTTELISQLLQVLGGAAGRDENNVPLIHPERMAEVWKAQEKHIKCIQDPPNCQLYTKTGSLKKGTIDLPVYRCARGSTSLESFHLHVARFIPGGLVGVL